MLSPLTFRTSLLKCARLLSLEINQLLEPLGLNYSLWQVLYVLERQPQCTAVEISRELRISKPSLSKRIQMLLDAGWIEQVITLDKRQKCLQLSSTGAQLHQQCILQIHAYEVALLSDVSSEQQAITHDVLNHLIGKMQMKEPQL